jgi:hypothetical protein
MSVEDAADEFATIVEAVYANKLKPVEKSKKLKECMEALLIKRGYPIDLKLEDEKQDGGCLGYDYLLSPARNTINELVALFWLPTGRAFSKKSFSGPIQYEAFRPLPSQ